MNELIAPVSVVVPCFRCAGTIGRAVESVAGQTLRPAEVILVDDCSGDDTWGAIEALARSHAAGWIKLIARDRNGGPGATRNTGWDAATQPYLAFLDADDAWHPQKIELQYRFMREHPEIALSGHRARRVRLASDKCLEPTAPQEKFINSSMLLISNRFVTPSVMLRRDLPLRFAGDRRHMEDHLLWLRIAFAGHRIVCLDSELAFLFKAPFGDRGLGAQLWRMQKAELGNYWLLFRSNAIGVPVLLTMWTWSLAKFCRRLLYAAIPPLRERIEPR